MNEMLSPADAYVPLDVVSVKSLVASNPTLSVVVGAGDLDANEIGDGNLNQVFVVRSVESPERAIVVKQALPYLRVAGAGWPLTRDRMRFETQSLLLYHDLIPGLAPRVYGYDHGQSWVAMQYLEHHRVMRHAVIDGDLPVDVGRDLGRFMAALAHGTSEMSLAAPVKKARALEFSNPDLCQLQEQFVFTNPFFESKENSWNAHLDEEVGALRADRTLKLAIGRAKSQYMTHGQALLHGDLHTGSVMVPATGRGTGSDTRVIDPEFAFFGPIAYDVGTLLANLAIGVLAHEELTANPARRSDSQCGLLTIMRDVWQSFVDEIEWRWVGGPRGDLAPADFWGDDADGFAEFRSETLRSIALDAGRHGGCEMLRRCMGIVSVAELHAIPDLEARAGVERNIIAVARNWLLDDTHHVRDPRSAVEHLIRPIERLIAAGRCGNGAP